MHVSLRPLIAFRFLRVFLSWSTWSVTTFSGFRYAAYFRASVHYDDIGRAVLRRALRKYKSPLGHRYTEETAPQDMWVDDGIWDVMIGRQGSLTSTLNHYRTRSKFCMQTCVKLGLFLRKLTHSSWEDIHSTKRARFVHGWCETH